ncbi:hypothetical protein D9758_006840 [Tetrapyrgos nigripes]|uniref:Leucine zipper with capping helix domain-containing protein n=1 Tax=Tetrapyrgos nigripes TaxID=182062 RepID=A0A8H5CY10_9AGAR|nr:hypothetical protein D9758_006840 [Tetrapyrgos nigripes]
MGLFKQTRSGHQTASGSSNNPEKSTHTGIVVFWSFPSQQGVLIQTRLKSVKEQRSSNEAQLKELHEALNIEKSLRVESQDRTRLLNELTDLKKEICQLDQELGAYGACDPVKLEETKRAITLGKEAAIRWTDNYGVVLNYFTRQNGVSADDVRKYLGVPEDYEDQVY